MKKQVEWKIKRGAKVRWSTSGGRTQTCQEGKVVDRCPAGVSLTELGYNVEGGIQSCSKVDRYVVEVKTKQGVKIKTPLKTTLENSFFS